MLYFRYSDNLLILAVKAGCEGGQERDLVSQQSMQLVRERRGREDHCGGLCSPNEARSEKRRDGRG